MASVTRKYAREPHRIVVTINPDKDEDIYLWLEQQKHGSVNKTIKAMIRFFIRKGDGREEHDTSRTPAEHQQSNRECVSRVHEPANLEGYEMPASVDEVVRGAKKPSQYDEQTTPPTLRQGDSPATSISEPTAKPVENEQPINPAVLERLAALQNSFS